MEASGELKKEEGRGFFVSYLAWFGTEKNKERSTDPKSTENLYCPHASACVFGQASHVCDRELNANPSEQAPPVQAGLVRSSLMYESEFECRQRVGLRLRVSIWLRIRLRVTKRASRAVSAADVQRARG